MMNSKNYFSDYRSKLKVLKEADREFEIFGAGESWGGHFYKLNRPIAPDTMERFESKFAIKLPAHYKLFLTQVGNGGAGPAYGLIPLLSSIRAGIPKELVSETFAADTDQATQLMKLNFAERTQGKNDWEYTLIKIGFSGYLDLADYGCGEYAILVLTGSQKGKVWYRFERKAYPMYTEKKGVFKQLTFKSWYDDWLNQSLSRFTLK